MTLTATSPPAPSDVIVVTYQFSGSADNLVSELAGRPSDCRAAGRPDLHPDQLEYAQTVTVSATDDGIINGQQVVVFPSEPRSVDQVQGPL